jgi:adenylate kinase
VFDGFPRTIPQAEALQGILLRHHTPLDLALWLDVSADTIKDRISHRLQCQSCGFTTSEGAAVFSERAICPYCDGPLIRRTDDDATILETRLSEFNSKTQPVADHYGGLSVLRKIDGNRDREAVFADISRLIEQSA